MKLLREYLSSEALDAHIQRSLDEDLGTGPEAGDHSSQAALSNDFQGIAQLKAKQSLVFAGVDVANRVLRAVSPQLSATWYATDGDRCAPGDVVAEVRGPLRDLLGAERTLLNYVQRLSGVATVARSYVDLVSDLPCRILDTRKTTPGWRMLEKWAVQVGGAQNHRVGLHDMVMLKDNHVDLAGGITEAVRRTERYLHDQNLVRAVEVECRNLDDVREALALPRVDRIMLDNFTPEQCREAVALNGGQKELEASGGITRETLRRFAETGVDFISVGALTHSAPSVDLNFKAQRI
ncbi:MAG: carboxylating nicotinate-nucleotide diphosphorylase [Cryomorphaceae bacterium]|nr:carboxylating nicotinate-nucleotide diphosphorylase [Cryomorphaceae bacterium]